MRATQKLPKKRKRRSAVRPFQESSSSAPKKTNAGWFKKGEPGPALKTGAHSKLIAKAETREQAEMKAALAERVAKHHSDMGGQETLSQYQLDLVGLYIAVFCQWTYMTEQLQATGPLTGKGRMKALYTAWLAASDRLVKLATTLGLEKKAKQLPTSLREVLQQRQGEQA